MSDKRKRCEYCKRFVSAKARNQAFDESGPFMCLRCFDKDTGGPHVPISADDWMAKVAASQFD